MATSRSAILTAAWSLFARDGADGISMRRIAARVGVTPMALYRHYSSKEQIVDALVQDAFEHWEARIAATRARGPRAWVLRLGEAYLDFALNEPRHFEAAFLLRTARTRRYPDDFSSGKSPAFAMFMPHFERAIASGRFRRGRSRHAALEVAMTCWGHVHGLVVLYRTGRFTMAPDQFRSLYLRSIRRLLEGLEAPQPKGRHR